MAPKQRPGVSSTTHTADDALPPPVDHRRHAGVRESPGLPVSCVHGGVGGARLLRDEALKEALLQRICGHYAAAIKLLPVAEHPELVAALESGAAPCLGLLEPRSNIVVNAVDDHIQHRRRRRRNLTKDDAGDDPARWLDQAWCSLHSLVAFLMHYFRHLSRPQALGYLYLADADLVVAMGLVETDLAGGGGRSHFTFHAPHAERAAEALYAAAGLTATGHPYPGAVARLVHRSFDAAMAERFQPVLGKHPIDAASLPYALLFLTGEMDEEVTDSNYWKYPPGRRRRRGTAAEEKAPPRPPITVCGLRRRKYGVDRLVLPPPLAGVRMPRPAEGEEEEEAHCAYEETLRKLLLDATHICYLQAFARLADPAVAAAMHVPIVRSGFCFGALDDPVDNILANAIWFRAAFPSQSPAAAGGDGDGDTRRRRQVCNVRLAALCARSLDAAVAYLGTRFAATLSRHDATLLLHRAGGCNVARAAELAELAGHAPCGGGDAAAVRAAVRTTGHPEEESMASFVCGLSPEAKTRVLGYLSRQRPLGVEHLEGIVRAFAMDFCFPLEHGVLPRGDHLLSARARVMLKNLTWCYENEQRRIMRKLEKILDKETEVLCVFGATTCLAAKGAFYHVNFLARNANEDHWDIFFAQISYDDDEDDKSVFVPLLWSEKFGIHWSRTEARDLLALAMCAGFRKMNGWEFQTDRRIKLHDSDVSTGRCIFCEGSRTTKIFHPNYGKQYKGSYASMMYHDVRDDDEDDKLKSDCVYFNNQRDIGLIERLNARAHEIYS